MVQKKTDDLELIGLLYSARDRFLSVSGVLETIWDSRTSALAWNRWADNQSSGASLLSSESAGLDPLRESESRVLPFAIGARGARFGGIEVTYERVAANPLDAAAQVSVQAGFPLVMLDPSQLLALCRFHDVMGTEKAITALASYTAYADQLAFVPGADSIELVVDRDRGVLLSLKAMYDATLVVNHTLRELRFDEL